MSNKSAKGSANSGRAFLRRGKEHCQGSCDCRPRRKSEVKLETETYFISFFFKLSFLQMQNASTYQWPRFSRLQPPKKFNDFKKWDGIHSALNIRKKGSFVMYIFSITFACQVFARNRCHWWRRSIIKATLNWLLKD